jgi:hypothetical protein
LKKTESILLLLSIGILAAGCSGEFYLHPRGYGPIEAGMRIDIAYNKIGKRIDPGRALTEEDMKCFYASIENISDSLVLTVIDSHIMRFDCKSRLIGTEKCIYVGDTADKIFENYGDSAVRGRPEYLSGEDYSISIKEDDCELIFIVKNDVVQKIITGKLNVARQEAGCK